MKANIFYVTGIPFGPLPDKPKIRAFAGYVYPRQRAHSLVTFFANAGWNSIYVDRSPSIYAGEKEAAFSFGQYLYVIKDHVLTLENEDPIVVIVDQPDCLPVLETVTAQLLIYDPINDAPVDQDLLRRADLVWCSSHVLYQTCVAQYPEKTYLLLNGCDGPHFAAAQHPFKRPEDLPTGKPILGFFGSLAHWLDWELLSKAADLLPDWQIVMIGTRHQRHPLVYHPNIAYLGYKQHAELPAYLHFFDVAMCPYQAAIHRHPIKVYEYLAAGKPVVATAMPELASLSEVIAFADHPLAFAEMVRKAAKDTSPESQARRQTIAYENGWDQRVRVARGVLEQALRG